MEKTNSFILIFLTGITVNVYRYYHRIANEEFEYVFKLVHDD